MGSTFRYVHDDAMYACGGTTCHFCESSRDPIYSYNGLIVAPDLAANPELAHEEPEISELCARCIVSGHVQKDVENLPIIRQIIDRFAGDKQLALKSFHRTPDIPLCFGDQDWPICCRDWCEFVGVPSTHSEAKTVPRDYRFWLHEPVDWMADYDLKPESLREVNLFRCVRCSKQYFFWYPS